MLREKITSLITKSIKKELNTIENYSTIYYKVQVANNFSKGGVFNTVDNTQNLNYLIGYVDSLEFFRIYNEALLTNERFNNIEIHFDKNLTPNSKFIWDQEYYDEDVEDNKKLRMQKIGMTLLYEFEIAYLNPIHAAYPSWLGGERWLQLYDAGTSGMQVVATKGLSNGSDFLHEVYVETDESLAPDTFSSSWQANLVYETGRVIPNVPNFTDRVKANTYLCLQVQIDGAPPEWSLDDENGNIGLFMGLQGQHSLEKIQAPSQFLNVKLMRPGELLYSIENDKQGRLLLAELYMQQGNSTVSNLTRQSVI